MGKSADEDVSQNIYRSQVLTESNFDTNDKELLHMEKEIDVQEGPLLTDGEDGDNVNSAKKLKIQTGNCQLSFYNSDIFDLANSEELIKTDRNIDTNLAQNKTELSISKSNFSTGNINISFVENKGQESPKQNTDNSSVGINPKDKNNVISSHSTSLHVNSATRDIGKRDCNVTKKDILNTSYSIYKKPIVHHHEKVLSTSDVVEPQFQTTTSNENNENSVKGLSSNSNSAKIDELTIDKKGQDFLWTFIEGSSQSNNGTALSSSGKKSDACYDTSSLYDQSGLTFEDHDLFCDSCEDFHPRTQAMQQSCQKHKKVVKENSLLSSVLDKKNSSTVKNSLFNKKQSIKHDNKLIDEDIGPKTQSVILSKGKRYLVQFKTKVVNYALNHNVKDAASKYTVNRGTVSEWLAEHKRLSGEDSPNLHLNKVVTLSCSSMSSSKLCIVSQIFIAVNGGCGNLSLNTQDLVRVVGRCRVKSKLSNLIFLNHIVPINFTELVINLKWFIVLSQQKLYYRLHFTAHGIFNCVTPFYSTHGWIATEQRNALILNRCDCPISSGYKAKRNLLSG
ncbi:hypothetical protein J6590_052277 [Homalodisca vitripennis]|nr:hypothetical protein J6590_052277 [Homalodisca vitripennis]